MNPYFQTLPPTIFDVMSTLAAERGAINLGQGFPEEDGPRDVREYAARALLENSNQYPPMRGLPALREAVAAHYGRMQGVDLDWKREVTVTSGGTEALAASIRAAVSPGDEVILIEPAYDCYAPQVEAAGGVVVPVRLEPPYWTLSAEALDAAFTQRTRALVLNTPSNPAAVLLDAKTLAMLAERCVAHDVIVISDEVWEHLTFDGRLHDTMLNAPGMRERTIKIGSAGKMFSLTGWKVGFVCAAPALTEVVARSHQFLTFTTPPNLQSAVAWGLAKERAHFDAMRAEFSRQRDRMAGALQAHGFVVTPCEGTYFMNVDLAASGVSVDDATFARHAVENAGVASIPLSAFYKRNPERGYIRLCFAKRDATIDEGVARLAKARALL
jgi:N-succinyldiaminopimelate aminotransferase